MDGVTGRAAKTRAHLTPMLFSQRQRDTLDLMAGYSNRGLNKGYIAVASALTPPIATGGR